MVNMLSAILLPFLPIVWILIASAYWWHELSAPWLFFVAGMLALFGAQAVVAFLWDYWPHIFGHFFLEANNFVSVKTLSETEVQRLLEARNRVAVIQAAFVVVAAIPLLWWLKSGLSVK
jgi:hypothetical protein